ncbi:MAG: hypothetical protein ACPG31_05915 [Planctomycetota bacterium]
MRRTLPLFLLLLFLALGAFWLSDGKTSDETDVGLGEDAAHEVIAAPALEEVDGKASEPTVDRAELEDAAVEESLEVAADASRIRFEITTRAGVPGHPPEDAASWTARLCIYPEGWETFRWIEVPFDAQGLAVLEYPLGRELRRAVAIPPTTSAYGAGYLVDDQLENAAMDSTYLIDLYGPRQVVGKVATPEGQLLADVPVQAFLDQEAPYLGYWQDSAFTTRTDATGTFHFPQLGPGNWTFAVTPEDWLMVDPLHGRQKGDHGLVHLEANKNAVVDLGTFTVISSKKIRITVLDNSGSPITAAALQVFAEDLERDDLQATGWQNAGVREGMIGLPFEYRYRSTLKDGAAEFCLPRGKYRLAITNIPGVQAKTSGMTDLHFHTTDGDFTYRIYAQVSRLHGLLLDADGQPMPEAGIDLSWETPEGTNTSGLHTDAAGRFEFPAVLRGQDLHLHLKPYFEEGLPATFTVAAHQEVEEVTLRAPRTYPLHLRFQTPDGSAPTHPNLTLELLTWNPGEGADPEALKKWWKRAKKGIMHSPDEAGAITIPHLAPGSYEVQLSSRGQEVGRWTLGVGTEIHLLQVAAPR